MPTIREYHPVRIVIAGKPRDATTEDLVAAVSEYAPELGWPIGFQETLYAKDGWIQLITYDPHHGGACLSWYRDVEVSDEEYARRGQVYQSGREGH